VSHEPSPGSRFALATLSLKGEEIKPLSRNLREREGPGAKRREGEGLSKSLEGNEGEVVFDASEPLDLVGYEMADVLPFGEIAFQQEIVLARDGVNFRHGFDRLHDGVGHLIGATELAFDENEDRLHRAVRFSLLGPSSLLSLLCAPGP
jgi:hypothetical protein